ncbi:MAG: beta-3-deoxy-D-manno-oct-2-ulosonic acid transferase [Pseudomonadota bacterium]
MISGAGVAGLPMHRLVTHPIFLRSPPFPGVAVSVAAVSAAAESAPVGDSVLDAVADARVGGAFWGDRPERITIVVRAGVTVSAERLSGVDSDRIGIVGDMPSMVQGRRLRDPVDPWHLIAGADAVHADVEDELAIVAGLLGVAVFDGQGRAVPTDRLRHVARARIGMARYRDCFKDRDVPVAQAIERLGEWRRHLDGNRGIAAASGMAFWKRDMMRQFLWDGLRAPPFLAPEKGLRSAQESGRALAIWPSRVPASTTHDAERMHVPICRVEDGFLRSNGLGASLHPPSSVVIDHAGIYYNACAPSDLEHVLATHPFPAALVERAQRLRAAISDAGVTKYGIEGGRMIDLPAGRRTVLAVGQVDDDMSVRLGGAGVEGNLDFLSRVRRSEPDAWIIYRPHPDVQAGHRRGHLSEAAILSYADAIDSGGPLMAMVQAVDDVHVLSSLTGFEALVRGQSVTVHGMPFYAGWGLTRDLAEPTGRRGRRLTVDQLVAGTLILYPRYIDPVTRLPCGPELMVDRMASASTPNLTWLIRARAAQGKLRRFMTLCAEFLHD